MKSQSKELTLSLLAYLAQRDIPPVDICKFADIDMESIINSRWDEVTTQKLDSLWVHASQVSKDPLFGLHFGESLQLSALGAVGEIIKSSSTVGEGLQIAVSLVHLVTDKFTMELSTSKTYFYIYLVRKEGSGKSSFIDEQIADFLMAFTIHELDGFLFRKIEPLEICLPKLPSNSSEFKRILRCDKIKKGKTYAIKLKSDILDVPLLTANHQLQSFFLHKMQNKSVDLLAPRVPFNKKVFHFLISNAYLKIPSIEETASNFNISLRTFQRRLNEEGFTFQQIADSVRKLLAIEYIQAKRYPIKEISYILGYNEISAFSRAFKRWTGKAPAHYNGN
jgi:AraC-like DNA-binding protein